MPITINGSGTVTGITAGGLPDGVITTDDIAAGAVTDAKVNASAAIADSKLTGATCKAWVNFNGDGAVSIRASRNVSSITDNGVGVYTVNFTTALVDANYSMSISSDYTNGTNAPAFVISNSNGTNGSKSTTSAAIVSYNFSTSAFYDCQAIYVAIFR